MLHHWTGMPCVFFDKPGHACVFIVVLCDFELPLPEALIFFYSLRTEEKVSCSLMSLEKL